MTVVYAILKWFLAVVAIGGPSAAIAYGVFTWAGKRWIEQRLVIQLEKFKLEQQKELERLRHLLSSRVSRIHEKEFEVLPKAWFMLHAAHGSAFHALAAMKFRPDFTLMPEELFEEFLTTRSHLTDYQKKVLREREVKDRQKYFQEAMEGIELDDAREKLRSFNNYLVENRIFMTDELRSKFNAVYDALFSALTDYDIGKMAKDGNMWHSAISSVTHLQPKIDEVEQAVQKRLRYEEA